MKTRTHDGKVYGISLGQEDFGPGATWQSVIEKAVSEMGLAYIDEIDHVHCVEDGNVDHGKVNFETGTVDFDTVNRFGFCAQIPFKYSSISIDKEHV